MLGLIKNLVLIIVIAAATLYVADLSWRGKTVREHVREAYKSGLFSEGAKDIATWVGDVLKIGKKSAKDDITPKDREALEGVIKNELKDNVLKMKEEASKLQQAKGEKK